MTETTKNTCPVCDFKGLANPAYDKRGFGSHETCPSCGFQFGVSDSKDGWGFQDWRNRFYEMDPQFVAIVQRIVGSRAAITPSTRIYHDLRIAGDDAAELMSAIAETFDVTLEGFDFKSYFPDETEAMVSYWAAKVGFRDKRRTLTVRHMLAVLRTATWFEPELGD